MDDGGGCGCAFAEEVRWTVLRLFGHTVIIN